MLNGANHALRSLSAYTFPLFYEEWGLEKGPAEAWDNKGDIVVATTYGSGSRPSFWRASRSGDEAVIGARAVVTRDVPPYTIVGGVPARPIRKRFSDETVAELLALKWWDWPREKIAEKIKDIQSDNLSGLKGDAE